MAQQPALKPVPSHKYFINHVQQQKYSLKHKHQRANKQNPDKNATVQYSRPVSRLLLDSCPTSQRDKQSTDEINRTWTEEASNLNCFQNTHHMMDFNKVTSMSVSTKQMEGSSNYFMNPFIPQLNNLKSPYKKDNAFPKSIHDSIGDHFDSNIKSNHTTINPKDIRSDKDNCETILFPVSAASIHPLSLENYRDHKDKVSLRKNRKVMSSNAKSQLYVCLNYSDLKQPLHQIEEEPKIIQMDERNRFFIQERPRGQPGFIKLLCNTLRGGDKDGCQCQPKCHWISKWLKLTSEDFAATMCPQINQNEWQKMLKQIQKDIPRTQPNHPTFQKHLYVASLRQILINYCKLDWQVGYVQGMNLIAASIVYHSSNSQQSLAIMELIMRGRGLRKIYLHDLSYGQLIARRLTLQLRRVAFDLYAHMTEHGLQLQLFVSSWYFSLMGSFVPISYSHLIIDVFLKREFAGLNEIILTLLIYLKKQLMSKQEEELMMCFSSQQMALRAETINWQDLVLRSQHLQLRNIQF